MNGSFFGLDFVLILMLHFPTQKGSQSIQEPSSMAFCEHRCLLNLIRLLSNLKKCLSDESLVIPMKELRLDDKLNFVEEPVEIMDREVKQLKQSRIPIVKVRWNSKRGPEFTWEREDQIRAKYPHLFSNITPASN
ncbi:hypothetical protein Tco_0005582 [Tanacetum coccineum]